MAAKGTFDIPDQKYMSTESTRRAYSELWGEPYRGTDDDIREYAKQVPSSNQLQVKPSPFNGSKSRCDFLLWLLRENNPQ